MAQGRLGEGLIGLSMYHRKRVVMKRIYPRSLCYNLIIVGKELET